MNSVQSIATWFIDSGTTDDLTNSDVRYVRFLNATLLLFCLVQIPIIPLLITLELYSQLQVNLLALTLCAIGFYLNRQGMHLFAKALIISIVTANTAYFSIILGSSAPTHLWLIPGAVLGMLVFKPSEWLWATSLVGLSMLTFIVFEFSYLDLEPQVIHLSNTDEELKASHISNIFAMVMTLIMVGMMHRRFADSEAALSVEKEKSDQLLKAILPEQIAQGLRETGVTQPVRHEDVSLLFADIVGFTPLATSMPAEDVVALLAEIFKQFDGLITQCGVEKIKTIGDAYMVAGGVPQTTPHHAEQLAKCACGMLNIIERISLDLGHPLQIRIGLHRGPAVAGVIGTTKFAYDLWGESVNLASRLESSGEAGRIHISEEFKVGLKPTWTIQERGEVQLKGVGKTLTHWLIPRK